MFYTNFTQHRCFTSMRKLFSHFTSCFNSLSTSRWAIYDLWKWYFTSKPWEWAKPNLAEKSHFTSLSSRRFHCFPLPALMYTKHTYRTPKGTPRLTQNSHTCAHTHAHLLLANVAVMILLFHRIMFEPLFFFTLHPNMTRWFSLPFNTGDVVFTFLFSAILLCSQISDDFFSTRSSWLHLFFPPFYFPPGGPIFRIKLTTALSFSGRSLSNTPM